MGIEFFYPNGKTKALTFSYDDGQVHDRRLVEIFNKYQVKATFHMNSGQLDKPDFITVEELKNLYQGHEIACHGVEHLYMNQLPKELLVNEIWEDRRSLEQWTGRIITGMSYAFGEYSDEIVNALSIFGIQYARTVNSSGGFGVPGDFMKWYPTCHHNDGIMEKAKTFLNKPGYMRLPLFYIWGHSFEFERENTWDLIEEFCKEISFKKDTWYTTNIDYRNYVIAMRSLIFNVDNTCVLNPTGFSVWLQGKKEILEIKPGATVIL
ncbi:MAG TPA: polysaccharide deacetylase family protein [Mobilitalea sp.]|nr:polysaccharide deacetylase family protein [Mobilitalea sp.]